MITGSIVDKIYSIRHVPNATRRAFYTEIESRLDQWYIGLPESIRFETTSRRSAPPPHILFLHIKYWGAVLLLNRALWVRLVALDSVTYILTVYLIGKGMQFSSSDYNSVLIFLSIEPTSGSTAEFKAFDLAQGAAIHLSAIGIETCPVLARRKLIHRLIQPPFIAKHFL